VTRDFLKNNRRYFYKIYFLLALNEKSVGQFRYLKINEKHERFKYLLSD